MFSLKVEIVSQIKNKKIFSLNFNYGKGNSSCLLLVPELQYCYAKYNKKKLSR